MAVWVIQAAFFCVALDQSDRNPHLQPAAHFWNAKIKSTPDNPKEQQ